ncbi:tetratricopeptide repeat protein [Streptomyces virginiae]|uniref:SEL1-like repeat protein n=1 Tax=Streptomyces virginiae TaxID=1961 RepID=UPI00225B5E5B|nr:tetratricopeptide repeat protein [Streptomyces virginiae]MCX4714951.1 tetratricopeptide repeat protein [Streptomyces virginiae]
MAQQLLGEYRVFMPLDGSEIGVAPELLRHDSRILLWLDDLDVFLTPPAVSVRTVDDFLQKGGVIIATLRAERFNELSSRRDNSMLDAQRLLIRNARQVISRAEKIIVNRRWSNTEVSRARSVSDPRVVDAVAHADEYGVAEYLAAGPQLYDELINAWSPGNNPRGAALVSSAIDFKRAGMNKPVDIGSLTRVHDHYLHARGGMRLRPESFETALAWATEPLHATTSLLVPYEAGSYKAFDYLVDKVATEEEFQEIPDAVWEEALSGKWDVDFHSVGEYSAQTGRTDLAERAYRVAEGSGDEVAGAFHLGHIFASAGNIEQAETWYIRSAGNGSLRALTNLGGVYIKKRDLRQAESCFLKAAGKGDVKAAFNLANVLLSQERVDEASSWCSVAEEDGMREARVLRADIFLAEAEYERARELYLDMAEEYPLQVSSGLGYIALEQGEYSAAIPYLETALSGGNHSALISLAYCFSELGNNDRAVDLARQYVQKHPENPGGLFSLAFYLQRCDNLSEAEQHYRAAVDLGDIKSATNLGNLLSNVGRDDEAEHFYKLALAKDDLLARTGLAQLYRKTEKFSAAIPLLRELIREGRVEAYTEMGRVQEDLGRTNLAILWLKKAVDMGDKYAGIRLGYIYERRGEHRKATPYYRIAAEAGEAHAYLHLGMIFQKRGEKEKAIDLLEEAFSLGDSEAASRLGKLHWLAGDSERSEEWLRRGAENRDVKSMEYLAFLLHQDGRTREAREMLEAAADAGSEDAVNQLQHLRELDGASGI